jgi:hypothetical protein
MNVGLSKNCLLYSKTVLELLERPQDAGAVLHKTRRGATEWSGTEPLLSPHLHTHTRTHTIFAPDV